MPPAAANLALRTPVCPDVNPSAGGPPLPERNTPRMMEQAAPNSNNTNHRRLSDLDETGFVQLRDQRPGCRTSTASRCAAHPGDGRGPFRSSSSQPGPSRIDTIVASTPAPQLRHQTVPARRAFGPGPRSVAPQPHGDVAVVERPAADRPRGRGASFKDQEMQLTAKEFDLLRVLVREQGKVVSREQLMREIWRPPGSGRPRRSTCTSACSAGSWATTQHSRGTSRRCVVDFPFKHSED